MVYWYSLRMWNRHWDELSYNLNFLKRHTFSWATAHLSEHIGLQGSSTTDLKVAIWKKESLAAWLSKKLLISHIVSAYLGRLQQAQWIFQTLQLLLIRSFQSVSCISCNLHKQSVFSFFSSTSSQCKSCVSLAVLCIWLSELELTYSFLQNVLDWKGITRLLLILAIIGYYSSPPISGAKRLDNVPSMILTISNHWSHG